MKLRFEHSTYKECNERFALRGDDFRLKESMAAEIRSGREPSAGMIG